MILHIDQMNDVGHGHPPTGLHSLQSNSQLFAALRSHADYSAVLFCQGSPQPWALFRVGQNAQIFNQVNLRKLRFRSRLFQPRFGRHLVGCSIYAKNPATSVDRRQANDKINVSVPLGVWPPATNGVALSCGRAARLIGCTFSRSRDLYAEAPSISGFFGSLFGSPAVFRRIHDARSQ